MEATNAILTKAAKWNANCANDLGFILNRYCAGYSNTEPELLEKGFKNNKCSLYENQSCKDGPSLYIYTHPNL